MQEIHKIAPLLPEARERNGRRNHYTINAHFPLPDPIAREQNVGDLLAILTDQPASNRRAAGRDASG
jgi:hypothetical protein